VCFLITTFAVLAVILSAGNCFVVVSAAGVIAAGFAIRVFYSVLDCYYAASAMDLPYSEPIRRLYYCYLQVVAMAIAAAAVTVVR
jgi:hypothetical protein